MAAVARAAGLAAAAVRCGMAQRSWIAAASTIAPRCAPVNVATGRFSNRLLHVSSCAHESGDGEGGIIVTAGADAADVYPPSKEARARANVGSEEEYQRLWQQSIGAWCGAVWIRHVANAREGDRVFASCVRRVGAG